MPEDASSLRTYTYDDISLGTEESFELVLTESMVEAFAGLSGDYNPLHMEDSYAQTTSYGARIVHGFLLASFFSRLIGMYIPGKHAVYLKQDIRFAKPAFIGTQIRVRGVVDQKVDALKVLSIQTEISEVGSGDVLVLGTATVKVLQ